MHNYRQVNGEFPPTYIADEDGKPMHSWRVLLLPYLEHENLFDQYDFNEPWNGPNNSKLAARIPDVYRCPSHFHEHEHHGEEVDETHTNYVVVSGADCLFNGATPPNSNAMTHPRDTLAVVDVNEHSVHWMSPDDITPQAFLSLFQADAEFNHPTGTMAAFADGSARFVPAETEKKALRALLSPTTETK